MSETICATPCEDDFVERALEEFLPHVRLGPVPHSEPGQSPEQPWIVVLTGSTGSVGTVLTSTPSTTAGASSGNGALTTFGGRGLELAVAGVAVVVGVLVA